MGTITICNPNAGDGEQVDLWSVSPSLLSELQINERACLKQTRWTVLEKQPPELVLWPPHTCISAPMHVYTHTMNIRSG